MSKKASKPISKKTNYLLNELKRKSGVRDLAERFLIVCEDDKSAPNYFAALKTYYQLSSTSVEVEGSGGSTQPKQVVARAIALKAAASRKASGTTAFKHVWCIIDGDFGNEVGVARNLAKLNGIQLAVTTKCFEYWILLHFQESDASTHNCSELVSKVKKHWKSYDKGKSNFREIVCNVDRACALAKKLRKPGLARDELPEHQNPCSEIYLLIELLIKAK